MIFLMQKNQNNFIVGKFASAFFFFYLTHSVLTHCQRSKSDKTKYFYSLIFLCVHLYY